MAPRPNDRWAASFQVERLGFYEFTVTAWIDRFTTWHRGLMKKVEAGQSVGSELLEGAALVHRVGQQAPGQDGDWLVRHAAELKEGSEPERVTAAGDPVLTMLMARHDPRIGRREYDQVLLIWVDRLRAEFGGWYEVFPRSCSPEPNRHGTFRDLEQRLPDIARMGFDVVYLPPIHPIGRTHRKGPNNTLTANESDPGSPWAIGGAEGGHQAIHPELGTLEDFDRLFTAAVGQGIEFALDLAFQCSPDHPYVRDHPEWFRHRPDGSIQYAENPPKKYQDIYPLDFECADWKALWSELLQVVQFWIDRGIRIFRVDNPHTKPLPFWEWLIAAVRQRNPDVFFLAEAFTRPKLMKQLAKLGFSQSYTYFTWRNSAWELREYFTELTQTEAAEYLRPNLFANTPDILPEYLQHGGPAAFQIRLILAATLGATYGIYGPPFETFQAVPRQGSEEYVDNEKYEIRQWDWKSPNVFRELIALVNRIRRENSALQRNDRLRFHGSENDHLLVYSKTSQDLSNIVFVVVSDDPHRPQAGRIQVPLTEWGLSPEDTFQMEDLLTGAHFLWRGEWNDVILDPYSTAAHILRLRRKMRTEHDFDYFA
ncbi:Alpha-1,4-glucan:maltose-1-phosphate maltosyltransferase 2 [Planctomyces sp. SH-PL14]|nr:Alpha-1,4-glucan:maltose-1-phosphate maltosyltransferase 2 [Planctomyces sp. SH-PL14]